jgi:putative endonuclease
MYTVYVLSNPDGKLYVGQTADFVKRFSRHNNNQEPYTRNKGPWSVVLQEQYLTRGEAMIREKYLKQGSGRRWLQEQTGLSAYQVTENR